ncbi:WD40 repeat domain-containing protein [Paenibacillus rhizovicinus]|uniref:WD40 repeat domain-containing protein n=1 Tax=Paenibacillus rhizovicinus TaxID=2704463 RepID=A0A6C0NTR2_9BACL|nr:WD40 repeat domain-containing protein [Paenibacillus rhizovicinus]QHW29555.1 WD40 repeat domain-containing protein [Paenibacillus rhizovicinus]
MRKKKYAPLAVLTAISLLLLTSSCMGNPRSETIIIPAADEDQTNEGDNAQSFQVQTIYRLPALAATDISLLGWTSNADLVGLDAESRASMTTGLRLQRLGKPYEQFKPLDSLIPGANWFGLSPNGRQIAYIAKSTTGTALTLLSLTDGKAVQSAAPPNSEWQLQSRTLNWSGNSRFLSYLVSGEDRTEQRIVVCDSADGQVKLYPLTGLQDFGEIVKVVLSDDGSGALIETGKTVAFAKRSGSGYAVQYDHPSGNGESEWVNDSQFAFLGFDGTLFQYDSRNGELSVLLEKVDSFRLSPDRKLIAYTLNDQDTIFAGRLQGNNVLYKGSVYQGVYPFQMTWSPDGGALLVDGSKRYARSAAQIQPSSEAKPAVDLLPFIIQFR